MNKLFLWFLLLISVGFSVYDYFVDLEKTNQNYTETIFSNLPYDYYVNVMLINLSNNKTVFSLNNISYDYYVNLMFSKTNETIKYNLSEMDFDYYVNLDKITISKKYFINGLGYDYFVILNITGILNLTVTNSTIEIITPKDKYLNTTNVYFNYLVNNYTGKCYAVVDGKIKNETEVSLYKNVSFNLNLSSGTHSWFVVCGNKTSNTTHFYITVPEIRIVSPDNLEPEGSILFYIKVDSIENTTSYFELYNSEGNLILNESFYNVLYNYSDLDKGEYLLKVISKNNYLTSIKTLNFSVFSYSGSHEANVPENQSYVLIVLLLMLIYIINYKNKKGD